MNNEEYIIKWINGTLSGGEQRYFIETAEYKSLERLSKALEAFKAPEFEVTSEFQRLQSIKDTIKLGRVIEIPWFRLLLQSAAVILIMVGIYFFFLFNPATSITTLAKEKTELFLPDSSQVILNAFSKITYYQQNWAKERHVVLEGEAFFRVAKGSRFDVETSSGTISVLGTQFNVKMRNSYFEVTCYEGLVKVQSTGVIVKLHPNKSFRVVKGVIDHTDETVESLPTWLQSVSSFESVPFSEVLDEFERQYNITIHTKNVNINQLFTGGFMHSDISLALKSISIPLNLRYEISSDKKNVVLTGEIQ